MSGKMDAVFQLVRQLAQASKKEIESPKSNVLQWAKDSAQAGGREFSGDELDNIAKYYDMGARVPAWRYSAQPEAEPWRFNTMSSRGTHFDLNRDGSIAQFLKDNGGALGFGSDHSAPGEGYIAPFLLRARGVLPATDYDANLIEHLAPMLMEKASVKGGPGMTEDQMSHILDRNSINMLLYPNATEGSRDNIKAAFKVEDFLNATGPMRAPEDARSIMYSNPSINLLDSQSHRDLLRANFDPAQFGKSGYEYAKGGLVQAHPGQSRANGGLAQAYG